MFSILKYVYKIWVDKDFMNYVNVLYLKFFRAFLAMSIPLKRLLYPLKCPLVRWHCYIAEGSLESREWLDGQLMW